MAVIKLNEDDTTSSSRIFIKILWQVNRPFSRIGQAHKSISIQSTIPSDFDLNRQTLQGVSRSLSSGINTYSPIMLMHFYALHNHTVLGNENRRAVSASLGSRVIKSLFGLRPVSACTNQ